MHPRPESFQRTSSTAPCSRRELLRGAGLAAGAWVLGATLPRAFADSAAAPSTPATAPGDERDLTPLPPEAPRLPRDHRWVHPGLLNNLAELEFIRRQVRADREPWRGAFAQLQRDHRARLDFVTQPVAVVDCRVNQPDFNPRDTAAQNNAGHAAYAHALQGFLLEDPRHFAKAAEILDAWSGTLREHVGLNRGLQAGWMAPVFCRAAELLRHAYPAWPAESRARFVAMLRGVFLPLVVDGVQRTAGNWELSFTEAVLAIGVFCEDAPVFNRGLYLVDRKVPLYFYLARDGERPRPPVPSPWDPPSDFSKYAAYQTDAGIRRYWYRPESDVGPFHEGQCQETCRDLLHTQMGTAALANCLEIALKQGVDLYAPHAERIARAMEFNANFFLGAPVPPDLNGGVLKWADKREPAWEVAYNHLSGRLGLPLPLSERVVRQHREKPLFAKLHMAYETLTHGDLAVGLTAESASRAGA